jgi:hypothetical protein
MGVGKGLAAGGTRGSLSLLRIRLGKGPSWVSMTVRFVVKMNYDRRGSTVYVTIISFVFKRKYF